MTLLHLGPTRQPSIFNIFVFWIGILLLLGQVFVGLIIHIVDYGRGAMICINEIHYLAFNLIPPLLIFSHALMLKYLEQSMNRTRTLHACTYGIVLSLLSTAIIIGGAVKSWGCSHLLVRVVLAYSLCVTLVWTALWLVVTYQNFIRRADESTKVDLLVMVRCGCFSKTTKRACLISPYILAAMYAAVLVVTYWNKDCSMPYIAYSSAALVSFLLMGAAAGLLLSYGRHHIASTAMAQELSESGHSSNNGVVYHRSDSLPAIWLPLTALWTIVGAVNCFAFVWGALGLYWLSSNSACDSAVEAMVYTVSVLLIGLTLAGFFMSCVLKLEHCFPSPLDPTPLHGSRIHHGKGGNMTMTARLRKEFNFSADRSGGGGTKYTQVLDDSFHAGP